MDSTDPEPSEAQALTLRRRVVVRADRVASFIERNSPTNRVSSRQALETDDWAFLRVPAIQGFFAICAIVIGASFPNSPFKLDMPGTWFFGVPSSGSTAKYSETMLLVGLILVYGGLVFLARVWIHLSRALTVRPGVPIRYLGWIFVAWIIPMLVVAPLFSRDVFSYAAQGEMVTRHVSPYLYGPWTLGAGPWVNPVDHIWQNAPAPYGPMFMMVDGWFASLSLHHELVTVVMLRFFALAGVVLIAYCVPKLAAAHGRDPGKAFVLAALNPLVVLTLVGGAHNDAIMAGLMLAGMTAAKYKRPVLGIVLCALAAAVKAPAAIGIFYIAWDWLGVGIPIRQRLRPLAVAGLITAAVFATLTVVSGLGIGWIKQLSSPGTVRSWLAPSTGLGMFTTWTVHQIGLMVSLSSVLAITRTLGLVLAVLASLYLIRESDRIGSVKACGLTLLLFVILGPVVQPWYLTWGIVLLAPIAVGRLRTTIIVLSVISPFIGLPGGQALLVDLLHSDPLAIAGVLLVVLMIFLAPLGKWAVPLSEELIEAEDKPIFRPLFPRLSARPFTLTRN